MIEANLQKIERTLRARLENYRKMNTEGNSLMIPATECRDHIDHVSAGLLNNVQVLLQTQGHELVEEIEAALSRLKSGQYGECLRCEEDIGLERLEANPAAALCFKCQSLFEKRYC
jgi:DnaK suppressor protein